MNQRRPFARRALYLVSFGLLAFAISALAGGIWSVLLLTNLGSNPTLPWSVPVMAVVLWLGWSYLNGKGWPSSTAEARRQYLRANHRSFRTYAWSLGAGVLSIVALAGCWIVLFRLIRMPPNAIPDTSGYPWITIVLMAAMGSLVAPFMEEASFRGYFQVALERELRAPAAVIVSSLVFALAHYTHGFVWPKLLVYFLVGVTFGVTAYLTNSTLPAIAPHIVGDLAFFFLVWPHDAARRLVSETGGDVWFWIHVAQALVFTILAVWAFQRLAKVSAEELESGPPQTL